MDISKSLLELILDALDKEVIEQIGGEPINIQNYLLTDYFTFVLDEKQYDVTFKERFFIPGRHIEHIRRGSNFIKDLLSMIFNNYNLLFITNSASLFTLKNIFMPPMDEAMAMQPKAILDDELNVFSEDYQFHINFLINIRDTINGFTTNKKIIGELNVMYNDGSEPTYFFKDKIVPATDDIEEIKMLQPDILMKLHDLTKLLRLPEEKEKILQAFLSEEKTDLTQYVIDREGTAPGTEIVNFEYNVTPIAIFAIKTRMKNVEFTAISGNRSITSKLQYNHLAEVKYKCPNCGHALKTKLVMAKGDEEYVLACQECAVKITSENSVYNIDDWYLADQVSSCYQILEDGSEKMLHVLRGDVGVCQIDKREYYKKDLICYDYIKSGSSWFTNKNKHTVHQRHAHICKNCSLILVGASANDGFHSCSDVDHAACIFCVGKEKSKNMKREYFISEYSSSCFALKDGLICSNCGRMTGRSEAVECELCQESVCPTCAQEKFCIRCQSVLNSASAVAKIPSVWRKIKNNFLLRERRKKKLMMEFRKSIYSSNMELRVAYQKHGKTVLYYFHQVDDNYVYIRRKKYVAAKRKTRAEDNVAEQEEGKII